MAQKPKHSSTHPPLRPPAAFPFEPPAWRTGSRLLAFPYLSVFPNTILKHFCCLARGEGGKKKKNVKKAHIRVDHCSVYQESINTVAVTLTAPQHFFSFFSQFLKTDWISALLYALKKQKKKRKKKYLQHQIMLIFSIQILTSTIHDFYMGFEGKQQTIFTNTFKRFFEDERTFTKVLGDAAKNLVYYFFF